MKTINTDVLINKIDLISLSNKDTKRYGDGFENAISSIRDAIDEILSEQEDNLNEELETLKTRVEELEDKVSDNNSKYSDLESENHELLNEISELRNKFPKNSSAVDEWKDELWKDIKAKYTLEQLEELLK